LKALAPLLADSNGRRSCTTQRSFSCLRGGREHPARDATVFVPAAADDGESQFCGRVMRQFSSMMGGGPGERADYLQRLAPALHAQVKEQKLESVYEKIDLRWRRCWRTSSALGSASIQRTRQDVAVDGEGSPAAGKRRSGSSRARNSTSIRRRSLRKFSSTKLNLQSNPRRGKAKARSTAVDVLEELSAQHPLPAKIIEYGKSPSSNQRMWTRCRS